MNKNLQIQLTPLNRKPQEPVVLQKLITSNSVMQLLSKRSNYFKMCKRLHVTYQYQTHCRFPQTVTFFIKKNKI